MKNKEITTANLRPRDLWEIGHFMYLTGLDNCGISLNVDFESFDEREKFLRISYEDLVSNKKLFDINDYGGKKKEIFGTETLEIPSEEEFIKERLYCVGNVTFNLRVKEDEGE